MIKNYHNPTKLKEYCSLWVQKQKKKILEKAYLSSKIKKFEIPLNLSQRHIINNENISKKRRGEISILNCKLKDTNKLFPFSRGVGYMHQFMLVQQNTIMFCVNTLILSLYKACTLYCKLPFLITYNKHLPLIKYSLVLFSFKHLSIYIII